MRMCVNCTFWCTSLRDILLLLLPLRLSPGRPGRLCRPIPAFDFLALWRLFMCWLCCGVYFCRSVFCVCVCAWFLCMCVVCACEYLCIQKGVRTFSLAKVDNGSSMVVCVSAVRCVEITPPSFFTFTSAMNLPSKRNTTLVILLLVGGWGGLKGECARMRKTYTYKENVSSSYPIAF